MELRAFPSRIENDDLLNDEYNTDNDNDDDDDDDDDFENCESFCHNLWK
jgi:hypothetical protein